jgi:hypothetical protein
LLTLKTQKQGESLTVMIEGQILENSELRALLSPPLPKQMKLYCAKIQHMNSVGVKDWISVFGSLRRLGVKLEFHECPPGVVFNINLISNFVSREEVISLQLPFSCPKCQLQYFPLLTVKTLLEQKLQLPTVKCTQCQSVCEFDDQFEEYLGFLVDP